MASSTAAPAAELRPAGPSDVRRMPRVLQAFQRDAAVSKAEVTVKNYVRFVKKLFKEDRIAIEDMVSESFIAVVKQLHSKHHVFALRCFSSWFQSHGLTADA